MSPEKTSESRSWFLFDGDGQVVCPKADDGPSPVPPGFTNHAFVWAVLVPGDATGRRYTDVDRGDRVTCTRCGLVAHECEPPRSAHIPLRGVVLCTGCWRPEHEGLCDA